MKHICETCLHRCEYPICLPESADEIEYGNEEIYQGRNNVIYCKNFKDEFDGQ